MLKKLNSCFVAFAAALTLALTPAQDAAAWERVCLKLPLWKTWFTADMHVVHSFKGVPGKVPNAVFHGPTGEPRKWLESLPDFGKRTDHRWQGRADGQIISRGIAANQERCVDIRHIPVGQPFFVYIYAHLGRNLLCETHHTNSNPWYYQRNAGYRDIVYEAWGAVHSERCEFRYER